MLPDGIRLAVPVLLDHDAPAPKKLTHHHVHVGRDGWLFLVGGRNRPLATYRRTFARWWILVRWAQLIRARGRACRALGCQYLHLSVPEKLSIYPEMTCGLEIDPDLSLALGLWRRLGGENCLNLAPALTAGKSDHPTYYRTDSHWTSEGCWIGLRAVCAALGTTPRWSLEDCAVQDIEVVGDLGDKFDPPRGEPQHRRMVTRHAVRVFANGLLSHHEALGQASLLHRGAHVVFRNESPGADPRRVVMFGDSFSHFIPHLLTGMLAETFRELHFVWSASIDWGYVTRVKPDILITEIAERFMARTPRDGFDLERFAAERLARGLLSD